MSQRDLSFLRAQNIWRGAERAESAQSSIQGAAGALWMGQEHRLALGARANRGSGSSSCCLPSSDPLILLGNGSGVIPWLPDGFGSLLASRQQLSVLVISLVSSRLAALPPLPLLGV